MTPDRNAIEYWFPTPVDYWIQFYYAATRWHSRNKIFIELEDLQKNPHIIAAALLEIFPERREVVNPLLPEKYLGRNADRHVSEGWEFETTTTLDKENQEASLLISSLSPGEVANIRTSHTTALYERLKRERSPKTVEAHSAT